MLETSGEYKTDKALLMAQMVCSDSATKAITAMFHQRKDASVVLQCGEQQGGVIARDSQHYRIDSYRLAPGLMHLRLISKRPAFVPWRSQRQLYLALKSAQYSTPILYSWMPVLAAAMQREKRMKSPSQWQCDTALLDCTPTRLDMLVSNLIVSGALKFEE